MTHLMPARILQPSSVLPAAVAEDFSWWRNIEQELAEELLRHDEYDGIAYSELEPLATLDDAYRRGDIQVWCLRVTLDALTLCGDILTVAVIEPVLYNTMFASARQLEFRGHSVGPRSAVRGEHAARTSGPGRSLTGCSCRVAPGVGLPRDAPFPKGQPAQGFAERRRRRGSQHRENRATKIHSG